jgi:hypothetical protein
VVNLAGSAARSGDKPAPIAHPQAREKIQKYITARMIARSAETLFDIGRNDTIPTRINVHRIESVDAFASPDRLGGLAYAPEFAAFIRDSVPQWLAEQRGGNVRWWDVKYVRGRMFKRFGKEIVDIALWCLRDEVPVDVIAETTGRSTVWIYRQLALVKKLAPLYWKQDTRARMMRQR